MEEQTKMNKKARTLGALYTGIFTNNLDNLIIKDISIKLLKHMFFLRTHQKEYV